MKKIFYLSIFVIVTLVFTALKPAQTAPESEIIVRTDKKSIEAGKTIFMQKCNFCHDAYSTKTIVGPGLKGVLKSPNLPVSKKPVTPENIANQLRNPYKDMPSFSYLPDDDVLNIIAFLNTL